MKRLFFLFALVMLFAGCRTIRETVEVPVYIHDTDSIVQQVHDSTIVERWHAEYVKGDSVYMHDSIVRCHSIVERDTIKQYIEKPVIVERTIYKEVERELTWMQRTFIYLGIASPVFIVAFVIYKKFRRRNKENENTR